MESTSVAGWRIGVLFRIRGGWWTLSQMLLGGLPIRRSVDPVSSCDRSFIGNAIFGLVDPSSFFACEVSQQVARLLLPEVHRVGISQC